MDKKEPAGVSPVACPAHDERDDRKSAAIAALNVTPKPGAKVVGGFAGVRAILRSPLMRQAGSGADRIRMDDPAHLPVFFLDGELHRRRRAVIAGYFSPQAIVTRYHPVMQRTMDSLIGRLRRDGSAPIDVLSLQMAVNVAAHIIGLTESDGQRLALRIRAVLDAAFARRSDNRIGRAAQRARAAYAAWAFYRKDLAPAVRACRASPRDDVVSCMVKEGYSRQAMVIECLSYGTAAMVTTREFIVMAAWHLFGNDALRDRYLRGAEQDRFAILDEIMRLEPVTAMLHRRATTGAADTPAGPIHEGELFALDIREANTDAAVAGACPHALDPDRAKRMKVTGSYMSFGDGSHRCPGAQVALHETCIFLDRLLRVPGIALAREPTISWAEQVGGYELRGATVTCDRA